MGVTGALRPAAYSVTENSAKKRTKTLNFFTQKSENFLGKDSPGEKRRRRSRSELVIIQNLLTEWV